MRAEVFTLDDMADLYRSAFFIAIDSMIMAMEITETESFTVEDIKSYRMKLEPMLEQIITEELT